MRHDETPKIDEQEGGWHGDDHFCPPARPERRGTVFLHARPQDYVTDERPVPTLRESMKHGDWVYWLYGVLFVLAVIVTYW